MGTEIINMDYLCPICHKKMLDYGEASFRGEYGFFQTPLIYCYNCDLFKRLVSNTSLQKHFCIVPYLGLKHEDEYLEQRKEFFDYILKIIKKEIAYLNLEKPIFLDFGCGYGHFLKTAKQNGFEAIGVELNRNLLKYVRDQGFTVYNHIRDVKEKVHVVTMIDSLYYIPDPIKLFQQLERVLVENGMVCIRTINRNWLLKAKKNILRRKKFDRLFGDAIIGYSFRSLSYLLKNRGFIINKVILHEKGKKIKSKKKQLYYNVTSFISSLLKPKIIISPGIIAIARKGKRIYR